MDLMGKVHRYYYEREPWTPTSWRECYKQTRFSEYTTEREQVIIEQLLDPGPDDVILDAGCGYGRVAVRLLSKKAQVIGVDISRQMINYCNRELQGEFAGAIADIENLPFREGSFDKIVCVGVLVHVESPQQVLREFARVLKPGGIFVTVNNNLLLLYYSLFHSVRFFLADWAGRLMGQRKQRSIMRYRSPFWYANLMKQAGFQVEKIQGDTFIGVLKVKQLTLFPPRFSLPWFRRLDHLAAKAPYKYSTFASYICARRRGETRC
jgi:ubiquinone/menaquinone biosynthesis C-methylase UbiE